MSKLTFLSDIRAGLKVRVVNDEIEVLSIITQWMMPFKKLDYQFQEMLKLQVVIVLIYLSLSCKIHGELFGVAWYYWYFQFWVTILIDQLGESALIAELWCMPH